jgi:hypothetical protein
MSSLVSRTQRNRRSGILTLEFALMLPFMFFLFIFAWDVIFVFNYEILGSYATFAAARSYAVFGDADLAEDVAAAVMSVATFPTEIDSQRDNFRIGAHCGVEQAINALKTSRFLPADYHASEGKTVSAVEAARARMTFSVEEKKTKVKLRKGYSYGGDQDSASRGSEGGIWEWLKNVFNVGSRSDNPDDLVNAKVAHVVMKYDFPVAMGYLRKPSFVLPKGVQNLPAAFTIYNSNASPMQPRPTALKEDDEKPAELEMLDEKEEEELKEADRRIQTALEALYDDSIVPVHARFQDTSGLKDASVYHWQIVSPEKELPGPIYTNQVTRMRRKSFSDPRFLGPENGGFYEGQAAKEGDLFVGKLFNIKTTLDADIKYRKHVKDKIDQETKTLASARSDLSSAERNLQEARRKLDEHRNYQSTGDPDADRIAKRGLLDDADEAMTNADSNIKEAQSQFSHGQLNGMAKPSRGNIDSVMSQSDAWIKQLLKWEGGWAPLRAEQVTLQTKSETELSVYDGHAAAVKTALQEYYALANRLGNENTDGMDTVLQDAHRRIKTP